MFESLRFCSALHALFPCNHFTLPGIGVRCYLTTTRSNHSVGIKFLEFSLTFTYTWVVGLGSSVPSDDGRHG